MMMIMRVLLASSGTNAGHDNSAISLSIVEINQNDLLPGAEQKTVLHKGDCQGWAQQSGTDMGKAVAVPPPVVVGIADTLGSHTFHGLPEVLHGARFELDGEN